MSTTDEPNKKQITIRTTWEGSQRVEVDDDFDETQSYPTLTDLENAGVDLDQITSGGASLIDWEVS